VDETLTGHLDDLEWWLRMLHRPVVDLLVPGAAPADLDRLGPLPADLREWFGWHDGVVARPGQTHHDLEVFPGYRFVSLAEAGGLRPAYDGDPVLGAAWLPVLVSADGDLLAAVWPGGADPPVRVAAVVAGEPTRIEFPSLRAMVEVFVECYRRGACRVGPDGRLTQDPVRYDEVYDDVAARP
jgi:hypothetical protein